MGETPETVSVMSGHSSAHWDASPRYTESLIGLSCSRERSARGGCPRSSRARRPPYLRDWSATDFLTSSRDGHAALFGEGSPSGIARTCPTASNSRRRSSFGLCDSRRRGDQFRDWFEVAPWGRHLQPMGGIVP